jgi:glycosyl hydrolase family 123
MSQHLRRCVLLPLAALIVILSVAHVAQAQDVLNDKSYWRMYMTWRTPKVVAADGAIKPLYSKKTGKLVPVVKSPRPPKDWYSLDFDDSVWGMARGPFHVGSGFGGDLATVGKQAELRALYLRGKFEVKDPKKVMLMKFMCRYVGGVVVYVNGKELQRGHVKFGKVNDRTLASRYDDRHYLSPDGKRLHEFIDNKRRSGVEKEWLGRFKDRVRNIPAKGWLNAVAIPSTMLRKGVNVVAIVNYSAPVSESWLTAKLGSMDYRGATSPWPHLGVLEARVHVAPGKALVPNIKRPEGVQLWNRRITQRVFATDYGDRCEPLRPIRLAGARNGMFSGQVVLASTERIENLKASVTDLKGPDGAVIAKGQVRVRFARPDKYVSQNWFDALLDQPPAELVPPLNKGVLQPIWVTVAVPKDAKPGAYTGTLSLEADDVEKRTVPIALSVADWVMTDSKEFSTYLELVQSPDTLAVLYKVPLWSDEHWKLIERSFRLMAQVGNKVIHIPVISRTYLGNEHSRIKWIKTADGYTHDLSLVEKYLDMAIKHLGQIPVVNIYCRDHNTGAYYFGKKEVAKPKGMPYTELDPKTGVLTEKIGPMWGTPECEAFWKPVFDKLYQVLKKRGLEKSFMVGMSGDKMPASTCVKTLKAVAPYAKWMAASHSNYTNVHGQPTGYQTDVWSSRGLSLTPPVRRAKKAYGWNNPRLCMPFPRAGGSRFVGPTLRLHTDLGTYHRGPEGAILAGARGYGRCGADFWPIYKTSWQFKGILARYPESAGWHGGSLINSYPYILAAGPKGPVPSARFEALRHGAQETEARVFIEKAMVNSSAKLGADLASKCEKLLDARAWKVLRSVSGANIVRCYYLGYIEDDAAKLYAAAAEVAKALGK